MNERLPACYAKTFFNHLTRSKMQSVFIRANFGHADGEARMPPPQLHHGSAIIRPIPLLDILSLTDRGYNFHCLTVTVECVLFNI